MTDEKIRAFAALVGASVTAGTLKSVTFHAPLSGDGLKIRGTRKQIGGTTVLQLETAMTEGRVTQENIPADAVEDAVERTLTTYGKADLVDTGGTASLLTSKKGAVTLLKKGTIGAGNAAPAASNDREKNRLLDGSEPFLFALGVADKNGRIHDKKQAKYRQICRFAEYIVEAEKKLRRTGTLTVCDLCCGKSYLSFAAYYVLTALCGRRVHMVCVDLKESVMDFCRDIAARCGMQYDGEGGMAFLCRNIGDFTPPAKPDLVISLHACDIATDIVLDFAASHRADVILATPCCQHELYANMDCPTLDFIADRPILKQKFCATATDALRLLKLDAAGYKTDATELIDPEDTPKNVMLRAIRRKNWDENSREAEEKRTRYIGAYTFLYGYAPK